MLFIFLWVFLHKHVSARASVAGVGESRRQSNLVGMDTYPVMETTVNRRRLHLERYHANPRMRRLLDEMATTELEADAYDHLVALTTMDDGSPNPRLSCTTGLKQAADYVRDVMQELNLVPLGNTERTEYQYIVENSTLADFCTHGLINTLGMIPGTLYPVRIVLTNS